MGDTEPVRKTLKVSGETHGRLMDRRDRSHTTVEAVIVDLLDTRPIAKRAAGATA